MRDAGRHGDCHSGQVDRRWCAHRAPARRPRRPRTEKSCGPDVRSLASSLRGDAAARPGARIDKTARATGARVHRSPGRARRTPLKPAAQGRPGDRRDLESIPCAIHCARTRVPAGARPSLRPLAIRGARQAAQLGRNAPRDRESVSAMKVFIQRAIQCRKFRHCEERSDEAIQNPSTEAVWIASRSLSSGRASRGPGGSQ